jgi:hypothetical protein
MADIEITPEKWELNRKLADIFVPLSREKSKTLPRRREKPCCSIRSLHVRRCRTQDSKNEAPVDAKYALHGRLSRSPIRS